MSMQMTLAHFLGGGVEDSLPLADVAAAAGAGSAAGTTRRIGFVVPDSVFLCVMPGKSNSYFVLNPAGQNKHSALLQPTQRSKNSNIALKKYKCRSRRI